MAWCAWCIAARWMGSSSTSSLGWQAGMQPALPAGYGRIVADNFDVGHSRRVAWTDRPRHAALLAALADADRGFDAVVVGEYKRAFCANQLRELATVLDQHAAQLWLPELGGAFDRRCPTHQALVMLLGAQSIREIQRSRFRTMAAMQAQVREQGRYLGGRPPYGYRLADAGPHPNAAHARWGRRLQRLEPDPGTAPHLRWIFAQRLAGHSVASIARALNERAVPCPSGMDPERNRHRSRAGWTLRTVATILANPRYTASLPRYALADVELSGGTVAAGDAVLVARHTANRDPRVYSDADRLDVTRQFQAHLVFGHGAHHCIGAPLARMDLQVALTALLDCFPGLHLAVPEDQLKWKTGMAVRGPITLPIGWYIPPIDRRWTVTPPNGAVLICRAGCAGRSGRGTHDLADLRVVQSTSQREVQFEPAREILDLAIQCSRHRLVEGPRPCGSR